MSATPHPDAPPPSIDDLTRLTLVDGLKTRMGDQTIVYKTVILRETGVADERKALRMVERVAYVAGVPKLLASEGDFKYAMTMLHIEAFIADGTRRIDAPMIDLELIGQLSSHDWGLIEQRVFLMTLAAEVRYGHMDAAEFELVASGAKPVQAVASPQPVGQAGGAGAAAAVRQPGPQVLADLTGTPAAGSPAGLGA